jgi:hypothetical protein
MPVGLVGGKPRRDNDPLPLMSLWSITQSDSDPGGLLDALE